MRRMRGGEARRLIAVLMLMTSLSTSARAYDDTEVSLHMGSMTLNTGRASPASGSSSGASFGVRYLHFVSAFMGFGLDLDFLRPKEKSTAVIQNASSTAMVESGAVLGVIRLGPTEDTVRPNFLFGLGMHFTSMHMDSTPKPGFVWSDTSTNERRTLMNSGNYAMAFKFQLGADYALREDFLAGAYLALNHLGSAKYETSDQARAMGLSDLSGAMVATTIGINLTGRF